MKYPKRNLHPSAAKLPGGSNSSDHSDNPSPP